MPKYLPAVSKISPLAVNGQALIEAFTSAMINLTTALQAQYMAEQTEQAVLQTVTYNSSQMNQLTPEDQRQIARTSVDAHLQKVQSMQLDAFAQQQLADDEQHAKQQYIGRKVKVRITDLDFQPIETYWWNDRTGDYDQGVITSKKRAITGIIHDISLRENNLVLAPNWKGKLLVPKRKYIVVYVINPNTQLPAVELSIV